MNDELRKILKKISLDRKLLGNITRDNRDFAFDIGFEIDENFTNIIDRIESYLNNNPLC